jgi:hypothetical protein
MTRGELQQQHATFEDEDDDEYEDDTIGPRNTLLAPSISLAVDSATPAPS